jgi:D-methionine transport system permease protein
MSPALLELFLPALVQTTIMVAVASAVALLAGIPLVIILVLIGPGSIPPRPAIHRLLGTAINALRSTPFIILLVALIPVTRLVVGTFIGTAAAIVPLSIAATTFFARIAEASLREVDKGLVEAAQAMGASRRQIVCYVLLPEALPSLIAGFTLTIVTLIGASAMAGAIGAGGLGDLAIRYGYQRFDATVMVAVVVTIIAIVCAVQLAGDRLARRLNHRL